MLLGRLVAWWSRNEQFLKTKQPSRSSVGHWPSRLDRSWHEFGGRENGLFVPRPPSNDRPFVINELTARLVQREQPIENCPGLDSEWWLRDESWPRVRG